MNVGEKVPAREGSCARCGGGVRIAVDAWFACASCFARHHEGCWTAHESCAVCSGTEGIGPLEGAHVEVPSVRVAPSLQASAPRPAVRSRRRFVPLALVGFVALTAVGLRAAMTVMPRAAQEPDGPERRSADAHMRRGYAFAVAHDYRSALAEYRRATQLAPRRQLAWENAAYMEIALDDLAGAERDVERALELDGGSPSAQVALATIWATEGHSDSASRMLERATANRRASEVPWKMVGHAYRLANEPRRAVAAATKAIDVLPDEAFAYTVRGRALIELGELDLAAADLARAVALDDASFAAHEGLAELHHRRLEDADAAREYRRALELAPSERDARRVRGWLGLPR